MTLTVFDLESTGLPHFNRPLSDKTQPRIMSLSAIMLTPMMEEVASFTTYIRPEGWTSTAGAKQVHNISERRCQLYGVRSKVAIAMLMDFIRASHEIASWGLSFDSSLIDIEISAMGVSRPEDWTRGGLKRTCIMEQAKQVLSDGKPIKLADAYERVTGEEYELKRKGLDDLRAAVRVMEKVRR